MQQSRAILTILTLMTLQSTLANEPARLVGLFAPDFNLSGTDGKTHRLAHLLKSGPVVVAWFPKAYTGNCEKMLRSLSAVQPDLDKSRINLLAVSGDKIKYLKPYAESIPLSFPILADPTRTTAVNWSVLGEGRELPNRWIFLISQDGRIAAVLSDFSADDAGKELLKYLQQLGWLTKS